VHDIALLSTLGVKLVLVHGSRRQVEESLLAAKVQSALANGRRITDAPALALAVQAAGVLRARIEALLSMGIANSPMHGARIRVCGGNFVTAQPFGVHEGVDFQHTGRLRRVDREGIAAQLALGNIVLISPLGYSPTGEIFNLSKEEVAVSVASALAADKLILLEDALIRDADGQPLRDLPIQLAQSLFEHSPTPVLDAAIQACQLGVERCHVLDYRRDGALLQELFTRDGVGTMINRGGYENRWKGTAPWCGVRASGSKSTSPASAWSSAMARSSPAPRCSRTSPTSRRNSPAWRPHRITVAAGAPTACWNTSRGAHAPLASHGCSC